MQNIIRIILSLCLIAQALESSDQKIVQCGDKKISSRFGVKLVTDYDQMFPLLLRDLSLPATTTLEELKNFLNQQRNLTISEQIEQINAKLVGTNQKESTKNYYFIQESSYQTWYKIAKEPLEVLLEKPDATLEALNKIIKEGIKRDRSFSITNSFYKKIVRVCYTPMSEKERCFVPPVEIVQRIFAFILTKKLSSQVRGQRMIYNTELCCYIPESINDLLEYDPNNSR